MDLREISENQRTDFNKLVTHVIQSWEWGNFRQSLGLPLLRFGLFKNNKLTQAFQLTLHKIPLTNFFVGYFPKGPKPDKDLIQALKEIGKKYRCAFIKMEPNVEKREAGSGKQEANTTLRLSPKPYFTRFNYVLDLTKSEDELLKGMHPKFRYNIKVAQKHGVVVEKRTDDEAFKMHLKLHFDTTKRQGFRSHNGYYHHLVWETLKNRGCARVLIAFYTPPESKEKIPLSSWLLLNFKDTLYYPYGGSSTEYKNVMASNLLAWEAVKLGKKLGLKKFDLWGAADPKAGDNDPYQGFTQFKSRLGAKLVEYVGTYDLVFNWPIYWAFNFVDKLTPLKIFLLKILRKA